jgi:hypothetical protein
LTHVIIAAKLGTVGKSELVRMTASVTAMKVLVIG